MVANYNANYKQLRKCLARSNAKRYNAIIVIVEWYKNAASIKTHLFPLTYNSN